MRRTDIELPATQVASVQAFIEHRIASRKPAAYLTQEAWLQGVSFYIDERAIVPRSLIAEVLAEGTIDPVAGPQHHPRARPVHGQWQLGYLGCVGLPRHHGAWAWICPKTHWPWPRSTSLVTA